ncbi:hypothetical protein [Brevibacillus parabrevis]|uniref:hypothetical protein n=1 Tax=Brevibacillus parabrevis TaxID=54914 RepID=UPI0028D3F3F8|nr:hypothetical protein [Brevibacillus parabrevis]MED1721979.1 hypothetical protein [Brevibacillus parabrevis]
MFFLWYDKLDVGNWREAVHQAREIKLLQPAGQRRNRRGVFAMPVVMADRRKSNKFA